MNPTYITVQYARLPEGFTQLQNLTHLYLNDTFLDYLPGSFGRLVKLKILEIRENHLKTLPKSFGRLAELERLDIGNNEFTDLPDVIGSLAKLLELWCDSNQISSISHTIGGLKQLMFLDASKNELETLPAQLDGCVCLADLHLSSNHLTVLPDSIGNLVNLTTLKVDDNQLTALPRTLGGLSSLSELNVSVNDLQELPPSIGLLRNLRTFYADENLLSFVPAELGSCSGITVLSLRGNKLTYIPDEIGRIPRLRVLNLSDNRLSYLPFTVVKLKELQALWLTENQTRPLIPLQSDYEVDTGRKILTCYLLPQGNNSDNDDTGDGDNDSFHASIWDEERLRRQQIHFNFADDDEDDEVHSNGGHLVRCPTPYPKEMREKGHLVRCPTPYPKEMREKARHMRNLAMRQSMGEGAEPSGWSPQTRQAHGGSQERAASRGGGERDAVIDVHTREGGATRPQSPSRQETHRLHRYDKEKLQRDKARLHRHSNPEMTDHMACALLAPPHAKPGKSQGAPPSQVKAASHLPGGKGTSGEREAPRRGAGGEREPKEKKNGDGGSDGNERRKGEAIAEEGGGDGSDTEDRRVCGRRKSTPNLLNLDGQENGDHNPRRAPTLTYEDLYHQQLLHKHHHPSRRSRRLREYDSDTGCRSDHHASCRPFSADGRDDLSVRSQPAMSRSQPAMSRSRRHGSRREGGYASDLEAYSGRGGGWGEGASTVSSPGVRPGTYHLHPTHSLPQDLDTRASSSSSENRVSFADQQTYLTGSNRRPTSGSRSRPPPPPSQFSPGCLLDQSTPVNKRAPKGFPPSPALVRSQSGSGSSAGQCGEGGGELQRELFTVLEKRKRKATGQETRTPSSSPLKDPHPHQHRPQRALHPPPYTSPSPSESRSDPPQQHLSAQNSPRDSSKGGKSFSNPHYTAVHFSQPERTSERTEALSACGGRNYETLAMVHRGNDTGSCGSAGSSQRSGHLEGSRTGRGRHYGDGEGSVTSQGHGEGSQAGSEGSHDSQGSSSRRLSGQDFPSPPASCGGSQTQPHSAPHPNPYRTQTPAPPPSYSHHSHTNRNSAHFSHVLADGSGDRGVSGGSGSGRGGSSGEGGCSSHPQRDVSSSRPRSGSRDLADGERPFQRPSQKAGVEGYPSPYGDPLEAAGRPLMSSYEDVAMFKGAQDPSSHVSSSTDSGYGHGHHVYERIGDLSVRRSGSPHSSTPPSQRDTSLRRNSSSQGTPSRETTPVKEEGFYSVHGNLLSETSSQESRDVFRSVIRKNPGLGFSIAGGQGSRGINPFRAGDNGIFVTKVQPEGPAAAMVQPGDKLLQVNQVDFRSIDHATAVSVLKRSSTVELLVERVQKINMV
ncbi:hypothetical protein ACOMHN_004292 [Nucella lapillus]